ncbi:MAG: 3-deoxy-D-manno-octulosonic acid transferase [Candidatus Omnitrophica bacterium]|nr:3-deoxy-D-manno-octulosonic acid transferase [Candidatus Omnitrophota bacterium]
MFVLYDAIFLLVALFYLPIYILRNKFHSGFKMRLGYLPAGLLLNRPIWIHAVSVGEAMTIKGLVQELRKVYPDKKIVISTITATGNRIAKGIAQSGDFVTYLPLDLSFIAKRVIHRLNPSLFILVETELWPNLILALHKKKIPIVTVNGRISDFSFAGYLSARFFIRPILRKISLFCVQAQRDKERLIKLGVSGKDIRITGNMKFDVCGYLRKEDIDTNLRRRMGLSSQNKLLVVGSTHPGEEDKILSVYKQLLLEFPSLVLLIAPRHPERSKEVGALAVRCGFSVIFISQMPQAELVVSEKSVFILDTVGKLLSFYSAADIVFVGGSLVSKGGHNILEPAALGKTVLFGPHMFNFRDTAELFLRNNAAVMVDSEEDLLMQLRQLLRNPARVAEFSERAQRLVLTNQGATLRAIAYLQEFLKE